MSRLKYALLIATLLTFFQTQAGAQSPKSIVGNWEGVLSIGTTKLRLVLKVSESPESGLKAVMDSVDQPGGNNLTVDVITWQNSSLHFEMKRISIVFDGTMNKSGSEIVGTLVQGAPFPMVFRREGLVLSKEPVKKGNVLLSPCNESNLSSDVLCGKYEVRRSQPQVRTEDRVERNGIAGDRRQSSA